MVVGDLIYNDDFDVNCNYMIFDCSDKNKTWQEAELIFSTKRDGFVKPLDKILDMKISYITMSNSNIIIEACSSLPAR